MLVVGDRRVWVHDATSGEQLLPAIEHRKPVLEAKFNFDGHRIVTASQDGTGRIHTETNGEWQTIILPGGDVWMKSADIIHKSPPGQMILCHAPVVSGGTRAAPSWLAVTIRCPSKLNFASSTGFRCSIAGKSCSPDVASWTHTRRSPTTSMRAPSGLNRM